jgi:hypothetical protein
VGLYPLSILEFHDVWCFGSWECVFKNDLFWLLVTSNNGQLRKVRNKWGCLFLLRHIYLMCYYKVARACDKKALRREIYRCRMRAARRKQIYGGEVEFSPFHIASSLFVFRACCLINEMVMKPAPTSPLLGPGSGVSERKWKRVAAVEMRAAELLMNELTSKVLRSLYSATHDYSFFCLKETRNQHTLGAFCDGWGFVVLWQSTPQHFLSAAWAYFLIITLCVCVLLFGNAFLVMREKSPVGEDVSKD